MTLIEKLRMVRCSIVPQGNLDPFDGLVTYRLVQEAGEAAAAAALSLRCKAQLSLLQLPMPVQAAIQPALARHFAPQRSSRVCCGGRLPTWSAWWKTSTGGGGMLGVVHAMCLIAIN